jgi:hypothetical protein
MAESGKAESMLGDMFKLWLASVFIRKLLVPLLVIVGLIVLVMAMT